MQVHIVTDVGNTSPCDGEIRGVFSDLAIAQKFAKTASKNGTYALPGQSVWDGFCVLTFTLDDYTFWDKDLASVCVRPDDQETFFHAAATSVAEAEADAAAAAAAAMVEADEAVVKAVATLTTARAAAAADAHMAAEAVVEEDEAVVEAASVLASTREAVKAAHSIAL